MGINDTFVEQAHWLKEQLEQEILTFTLNEEKDTIATVWIKDDRVAEKLRRMAGILEDLFGAYTCGPASTVSFFNPVHQSFGFWNQELLDYAKRVLPLPEGLRPGPIIYYPSLTGEQWERVARIYNKRVEDLPRYQ